MSSDPAGCDFDPRQAWHICDPHMGGRLRLRIRLSRLMIHAACSPAYGDVLSFEWLVRVGKVLRIRTPSHVAEQERDKGPFSLSFVYVDGRLVRLPQRTEERSHVLC